jgi:uncharacterized phage infection (PIP) family protein YhgE
MKNFSVLLTITLAMLFCVNAFGQLSKEEKKEFKKMAKEMAKNPEQLKTLIENEQRLQQEVTSAKEEVQALQSDLSDKNDKIDDLQQNLTQLKADLSSARTELASMQEAMPAGGSEEAMPGVVFKVQIGAFRNKDLSKYFENNPNFAGEIRDETQQITLGNFRDYWEADTFKKYLREMGVKDAWIVPYKDGERVPIKDVLEGVISQ